MDREKQIEEIEIDYVMGIIEAVDFRKKMNRLGNDYRWCDDRLDELDKVRYTPVDAAP